MGAWAQWAQISQVIEIKGFFDGRKNGRKLYAPKKMGAGGSRRRRGDRWQGDRWAQVESMGATFFFRGLGVSSVIFGLGVLVSVQKSPSERAGKFGCKNGLNGIPF